MKERSIKNTTVKENLYPEEAIDKGVEPARGTGLGSQVSNEFLWDIFSGEMEQSQVQSRSYNRAREAAFVF